MVWNLWANVRLLNLLPLDIRLVAWEVRSGHWASFTRIVNIIVLCPIYLHITLKKSKAPLKEWSG